MKSTSTLILTREDLPKEKQNRKVEDITYYDFLSNELYAIREDIVIFIDTNGYAKLLKNRYGNIDTNIKKVYSVQEVQKLLVPLIEQIEFYQNQYIKCHRFIRLPWYKQIFNKWSFIKSLWKDHDESDTLIENLSRYKEQTPEMFEFLKNWYNRKSSKYN